MVSDLEAKEIVDRANCLGVVSGNSQLRHPIRLPLGFNDPIPSTYEPFLLLC